MQNPLSAAQICTIIMLETALHCHLYFIAHNHNPLSFRLWTLLFKDNVNDVQRVNASTLEIKHFSVKLKLHMSW